MDDRKKNLPDDDDEDDRAALEGLSSAPQPPRKVHSYSHQLRPSSAHSKRNQIRNHSLDEARIPNPNDYTDDDSDDDDDFFPYSGGGSGGGGASSLPSVPEFVSSGGTGIFKAPHRAAVHPSRPPCIEIRPHPLRETQSGRFLRNIACTEAQLWAGQESGVRVWSVENAYEPGFGFGGKVRRGDEDAVPFHESANTAPTLCLLIDKGNRLLWSGHRDGKIRSWKMDQAWDSTSPFKEGLSWQAFRIPVLAMVISSYGDLWCGSEGGAIKVWPRETIEKSLSLKPEEKHMAALLVERSCIDLKSQVTVNGNCSISSSDVKSLLCDNIRAKVWCAGATSFSLWDARTRELLKVFNAEGQVENRIDAAQGQDQQPAEDEVKVKSGPTGKKEKSPGFLQRSRNAIMGAADAVRRVATRGTGSFVEEAKRTEALILAPDGVIWTGCTNGMLVQWDGNGNRMQEFNLHDSAVQCFCTFGTRIYVGYLSGTVQIIDLEGNLISGWFAYNSPVLQLAVGNGYVFSLATHGGIRAWNIASPGPIDNIIRMELAAKETAYTKRDNVRILVGTWNVGQGRAPQEDLISWLGSVASDVGIIVIGLQEVDMGAGFLAMSAAKETVGLEGSGVGQWWIENIGKALQEGSTFERMGSRQLAGLLISLWVRKNLRKHVGDIDAAAVPCGFGRAIGNKGGVGLRIRVYDRIMCFVNCHLAAHLEAVNRRNADFDHIFRNMSFSRSSNLLNTAAAGASTTAHNVKGSNNVPAPNTDDTKPDLSEADMVVFMGDFNYRLFGISYDEARDFVSQRCFDWLREKDQLREEMKNGRVFQGMREALIKFPPTYKFERHRPGLAGYDSGEKKRIPAWCDRVIYRDNRLGPVTECSLECPVISSVLLYEACMDVTESDHKPVRCKFNVNISHVDRSVRRKELGEIIKCNEKIKGILKDWCYIPETIVSTNKITLQNQEIHILRITNKCKKDRAVYKIICEGQSTSNIKDDGQADDYRPKGCLGFPRWLEITPAAGALKPGQSTEVSLYYQELNEDGSEGSVSVHRRSREDHKGDKEVRLVVIVQGSCTTKTASHRVQLHHSFTGTATATATATATGPRAVSRTNSTSSRKQQGSDQSRRRGTSSDSVDNHR